MSSSELSRRTVLTGAAAVPIAAVPAAATTGNDHDPIFAAIEAHRRAAGEWDRVHDARDDFEYSLPKSARLYSQIYIGAFRGVQYWANTRYEIDRSLIV
jgi:hypothetical protein